MSVSQLSSQRCLDATTVTFSGVHHHSAEAISSCHHRELLVAHLHIESAQVEVETVAEEVQVSAQLVVPRSLWFIGDGVVDVVVIIVGMRYVIVATHGLLTIGVQLGLQDVAEHLDVVTTCSIALAHGGIDVALVIVYTN